MILPVDQILLVIWAALRNTHPQVFDQQRVSKVLCPSFLGLITCNTSHLGCLTDLALFNVAFHSSAGSLVFILMEELGFQKDSSFQFSSVQFSHSVVSHSLRPHEWQHVRPPCPSQTPGVHPDSRPSSQWCHPAISSSVVPFSSCPQSLPASEFFPMSQLFAWSGQSTGVSASASFPPKKSQGWSSGWTGWISLQSKGLVII